MIARHPNERQKGKLKKLLGASAAALVLGAALANPSWSAVSPPRAIEVFHGSEFVGLAGYPATALVRVDVVRDGVVVGSAERRANNAGAIEINHGGGELNDCWGPKPNITPDILPGDTVRTTISDGPLAGTVDSTVVRDVSINTDSTTVDTLGDTITVTGHARGVDLVAGDALELRISADGFARDLRVPLAPADINPDGTFTRQIQLNNAQAEDAADALANGTLGQSIEWSNPATPGEITVFDGDETPEGCPERTRYAVTDSDPDAINAANIGQGIVISGPSFGASAAVVTLTDGTNTLTQNVTPSPAGDGAQTWTAGFPDGLGSLADGELTADATFTVGTQEVPGAEMKILKDAAPMAPATTLILSDASNGGSKADTLTNDATPTFIGVAEPGSTVTLSADGNRVPDDRTASPGGAWQFTLTDALGQGNHSVVATATDAAGNTSVSQALTVKVDTFAPRVVSTPAGGTFDAAPTVSLRLGNVEADGARIFYTLDGRTPNESSTRYATPFKVARTGTLKHTAVDSAGNRSAVGSASYTVRVATRTTLAMSQKAITLGKVKGFQGAVSPASAGASVRLTIERNGSPVAYAPRVLRLVGGRYAYGFKPRSPGLYTVQVSFLKDADNLGSRSKALTFRVTR